MVFHQTNVHQPSTNYLHSNRVLLMMIKNIEFKKITDVFQSKLQKDMEIVKQSNNLFISVDKSTNIYAMEKDDYNRFLRENITKTYKKQREGKSNQSIMT